MLPELEFLDVKTEDEGENIFRLTLKVHNKGIFGNKYRSRRTKYLDKDNETGNGAFRRTNHSQRIKGSEDSEASGDETAEFSWLISGRGRVSISAGSANVGQITTSIDLR